jgi:hypothetical protein
MATSSRQSAIFGVNDWQAIYQTFNQADFNSYDYDTLRKNFIDYLRLYYPETFNDFIESSEFIALLDVMAFMGQGLAFRNDLNTRENFIDTAERRDSVVKLANLVSYTPKRNIAGQGYLKVTSIQTTQNLTDLNGIPLGNTPILWNDPANPNWLNQFNTIANATLINTQQVGRPGNTAQIVGVKTDEYTIQLPVGTSPIVGFSTQVNTITMNFELCSVTSVGTDYIYEIPPIPTNTFNMLYRNDKLGYGSPNTGFFFYFKQGTLQTFPFNLANEISNQVVDIGGIQGVNNSDTWLFQLSPANASYGLWTKVENVYASAYLQTETAQKNIFSVNSGYNDQASYIFGDGVFSNIPVGSYLAYVRAGNALTYTIDPTEMQGLSVSINYISRLGRVETLTVGLALQVPVSTAQARETLSDIKQRAPTRYYTQNRMVNGEDYNNFPYTLYSSIIKSKAINRSSIGISKNLDLLDPTGKYSSTNSFANDGGLWLDDTIGNSLLVINNTGDIITFLSDTLVAILGDTRSVQYYIQNYPRYAIGPSSDTALVADPGDSVTYWQTSTVDANSLTGYFYNIISGNDTPVPVGTFSTYNTKYITKGALLKFVAPDGYYFDSNYRLVNGIASPSDITYIWTTVLNVLGDGYNNGLGQFANGTGPITLNEFVPYGAILTTVIPAFDNTLPNTVIQEALVRIELQQNFSLVFNNSLTIAQDRWSIGVYDTANYFVNFTSQTGDNRYTVTYRSLAYYFGSVSDTRFTYEQGKLVYDPFSGVILQDFVKVLETNTQPNSKYPLMMPVTASIVGQTVQSDGYIDDFEVEVASIDTNNRTVIDNPDFFTEVTGYVFDATNIGIYTFFVTIQDAVNLTRLQLLPTSDVVYQYATKNDIEVVKYDYPVGQLFYAYNETNPLTFVTGIFYMSMQDPTVTTPAYTLVAQSIYSMKPGRQGLQYQYRHNSNNTTRIDPATTNIIDLYLVTQAYYTQYQNYIQDSTNTIPEPPRPTIADLSAAYPLIQDYKMLSDSAILNSVIFKPLFGAKASAALRGTIKVIKNSNTGASVSEIRSAVLTQMNDYFNINNWNFGDTFYFSELSAYIHANIGDLVSSCVLVPNDPTMKFGDLYEIKCLPYEIFVNAATANDVVVIAALTPAELQIA